MSLSGKTSGFNRSDTITAIATAPGPSGISVIRISGSASKHIADKIFQGKIKPTRAKTQTVHFGKVINPTTKETIDEVLLTVFSAPNSYTGEDMIEISCHGGDYIASKIVRQIMKLNARLAEPGEFTKRRVLSGKMDITQAEATLDLIQVKNESAYRSAIEQLKGKLSGYISELTDKIKSLTAQIDHVIEFEEDPSHIHTEVKKIRNQIKQIRYDLESKIKRNEELKFLYNGIYCVIVGRPNVGKSSLFNRLSEIEKAIVTEIAGTTRDSLEHTTIINGITFHLIDTAGLKIIHQPKGTQKIEAMGIKQSKNWLEAADIVLAVFDNSKPFNQQDQLVYDAIKTKPHILVLNKIDLKTKFNRNILKNNIVYPISAKYNKGIKQLKNAVAKHYQKRLSTNNYLYLNTRHIEVLKQVVQLLKVSEAEKYFDTAAMNLRNALDILGTITNAVTNEAVLDTIFSQFCIGK
jgi:tRNA modification GTPase